MSYLDHESKSTNYLLDFAKTLEQKNIVDSSNGARIRSFIRKMESPTSWQIFLVIGGIFGALFASAGIFAIISHNWDEYDKHLRGAFSLVPVLVALYFYYLALFKHKDSKTWIEASSLFLMLMIGASIALVSQTYQMDGDFTKFIKVWLVLTIPLFYLAKASFISAFYLILASTLLAKFRFMFGYIPVPELNEELYWFWLLILAFIPHYYLALDRSSRIQGIRVVFMSHFLYLAVMAGLAITVKSNYLLWFMAVQTGFYLFGKRYMGENRYIYMRPFQCISQVAIVFILISLSNESLQYGLYRFDSIFNLGDWEGEQIYYFILLLVVMGGIYFNYFRGKAKFGQVNQMIVFAPFFIIFSMILDEYTTSWWWMTIFFNLYILLLGITTIVHGNAKSDVLKMIFGLLVIAILLWIRYFDNDLGFITKGIVFLIVGGMFFLINVLVKDKVEDIERHKKLSDEK